MSINGSINSIAQEQVNLTDYSKRPYASKVYADMRGVVDFGNLLQFAPFEGGYCFLAVINGPSLCYDFKEYMDSDFATLQETFITILEQEFRGLSGIDDISADTIDISDGISTMSLLGKVNQNANSQLSMTFTEKSGTPITTYVAMYLRYIRDPRSEAKTYGGAITPSNAYKVSAAREVFNMLYIITDSTCLNIEKAFLILNAQPTSASYGDLYSGDRGDISTKDVTVNWNAFVTDGKLPNKIAHVYMRNLIRTNANKSNKINLNSYEMDWSISGLQSRVGNSSELVFSKEALYDEGNNTGNRNSKHFTWDGANGNDLVKIGPASDDNTFIGDSGTYTDYAGIQ